MRRGAFLEKVRMYFDILPDKENEQVIVAQICNGVSFKGANLWVLIFAIFIASLGLNVNSTAVIIGAMLISPLMGPIIGMGLAVGINDLDLLRRSAKNYGVATLISVLTATAYFLVSPLSEAQSELLARTSPSMYDVFIAFCGGAAGIIALCTRGKGNVIPGVAIATALMPPLCTAGYGLATGHWLYSLGAFYLFFINTVFIALSTFFGVRFMCFEQHRFLSLQMEQKAHRIMMALVVMTMIPAVFMTVHIVRQSVFQNNVNQFVKAELTQRGTQIISNSLDRDSLRLSVVAVGKEISASHQQEAQARMPFYHLDGYQLRVIQGSQSDSLILLNKELSAMTTSRELERHQVADLSAHVSALNSQLEEYTHYDLLVDEIRSEVSVLFPQVVSLNLARVAVSPNDTVPINHYVAAIVCTAPDTPLPEQETLKLQHWLQSRTKADSLLVLFPLLK